MGTKKVRNVMDLTEAEMKEKELGRNCSKPKNEPIEMWEFQLIVDLMKSRVTVAKSSFFFFLI